MRITIVGAGHVGQALGGAWKNSGNQITFALREPGTGKAKQLSAAGFQVRPVSEAGTDAEVILLAVPWTETADALETLGSLAGKIVIDATNPLTEDLDMALGFDDSAGETVALLAPGARVVKAFNTTGAENMAKAKDFSGKPVMLIAGDDASAKTIVQTLAADIGFEAVDAGPLTMSRYLEPMAMLWIKLAYAQKMGMGFAFSLQRR
jgi:predicted dinucleotide-binding enzyme